MTLSSLYFQLTIKQSIHYKSDFVLSFCCCIYLLVPCIAFRLFQVLPFLFVFFLFVYQQHQLLLNREDLL